MPNWVFNSLAVTGEKADIEEMAKQLDRSFINAFGQLYSNPVFAFWNIIAPDQSIIEEYKNQPKRTDTPISDPNWWADVEKLMSVDNSWYAWNVRNWGSKWDVAVADGEEYSDTRCEWNGDMLMYHFNTPWSPPEPAMITLSKLYPKLEFELVYEEEQGWGGTTLFTAGEDSVVEQYDIPNSHADHMALDKSCVCDYENDTEEWYDDCPRNSE